MFTFFLWLLFVPLALISLFAILVNYYGLYRQFFIMSKHGKADFATRYFRGVSQAILFGGIIGMLACLFAPIGIAKFWYVPLLIDPGCVPFVVIFVPWFMIGFVKSQFLGYESTWVCEADKRRQEETDRSRREELDELSPPESRD